MSRYRNMFEQDLRLRMSLRTRKLVCNQFIFEVEKTFDNCIHAYQAFNFQRGNGISRFEKLNIAHYSKASSQQKIPSSIDKILTL